MLNKLKKIPVFETILLIWFLVVYFSYIYFHNYHLVLLSTTITSLIIICCWKYIFKKQIKTDFIININKSLWQYALAVLVIILIIAFVLRFFGDLTNSNFNLLTFLTSEVNVFYQIISKSAFLIGLVLLTSALGSKMFNLLRFDFETKLEKFIFSLAAGFLVIIYLTFFLTALGWLYFWPSWLLIILLTVFSRKEIIDWSKILVASKLNFELTSDLKNKQTQTNLIWLLVIIFFIIGYFATFRSFPTEFDDLDTYFNVPQLYSYYHHIVPFYNSPSAPSGGIVMTFYALINTALAPHFVFHLSWLFLIFLLSSLYLFTKKFFSQQVAITTLLLATFTPWHSLFIATQKIDFLFTFISILAVYSLFNWLQDKKIKWFYLTAIFIGFSLAIKINGIFLAISTGILLLILLFNKITTIWQIVKFGTIALFLFSPVLIFNLYYYQNPIPSFVNFTLKPKVENLFSDNKKVTLNNIYNQTNFANKRNEELTLLGRQNSPTNSKIINFFWLFWNLTINQKGVNMLYVEIGPYLLIFLPFFIYIFIRKKLYQNKNLLNLTLIATIFAIFWLWQGAERPWYGMAMFYILFIFCAIILNDIKAKKYKTIIYGLIVLFALQIIISLLTITTTRLPNTIFLTPKVLQSFLDDTPQIKMANFINQEIIAKNDHAYILTYLQSDIAYINKNDRTIIPDQRSVYWGKILSETNSLEKIKNILQNQGITNISYSTKFKNRIIYLISNTLNKNDYKIVQEINKFEEFKDQYLSPLYCADQNLCIYTINQ
jgi:hypothetical protein